MLAEAQLLSVASTYLPPCVRMIGLPVRVMVMSETPLLKEGLLVLARTAERRLQAFCMVGSLVLIN